MPNDGKVPDFDRIEFLEACAMTRFVIDIIIRLISILLPLSLGLTTFGFTTRRWELFVVSALVLLILGLIIWRTYRLVNGFVLSVLVWEQRFSEKPALGPFHMFVALTLGEKYRRQLQEATSTLDSEATIRRLQALPPAHLGTPRSLVYGGLLVLGLFNLVCGWQLSHSQDDQHAAPATSEQRLVPLEAAATVPHAVQPEHALTDSSPSRGREGGR